MPTEVIQFLDQFNLGSAIQLLIGIATCLGSAYVFVKHETKKFKEKGSQETLEKLANTEEKKQLEEYGARINSLENDLSTLHEGVKKEVSIYQEMEEKLHRIDTLEQEVQVVKKEIIDLMTSSVSINRSLILQVYNRCVINEKTIDLMSLQNVEKLYDNYLAEVKDGGDEFINKIMSEIRDLPTRSE